METFFLIILGFFFVILSALLLKAVSHILKLEDHSYKTALKVTLSTFAVPFVCFALLSGIEETSVGSMALVVVILISVLIFLILLPMFFFIKKFYGIHWKKAIPALLLWLTFNFILFVFVIIPIWGILSFVAEHLSIDPSML